MDRDINSAKNLLKYGRDRIEQGLKRTQELSGCV